MLLTLKMLSRAGLTTAIILWGIGTWAPTNGTAKISASRSLVLATDDDHMTLAVVPPSPYRESGGVTSVIEQGLIVRPRPHDTTLETDVVTVWNIAWAGNGHFVGFSIDHWLVCLAFLIATVGTSVRWRKRPVEMEQESADE